MKTSVIIPVWNGARFLAACLDALLAQKIDAGHTFEVIAVDNASVDQSADLIAQRYPNVRLIRNAQNQGFAGGCNRGIEAAVGDLIVLLNQDTQVQPGWLAALVAAASVPTHGVVGCKILYPDRKLIQHAGGWMAWPLALSHHHGYQELDQGRWDSSHSVEWVTGAALAVRRDVLDQVGLLDEAFWPGYFEDADFCLRVKVAGYQVYYAADAVVLHQETSSLTDQRTISSAYQRGRLRFVFKHLPPARWLTEFLPAERAYQPAAVRGAESAPLQSAYMGAMIAAPYLLAQNWQADAATIRSVVQALRELYQQAWREEQVKSSELAVRANPDWGKADAAGTLPVSALPPLTEFVFHSQMPLIGPLLGRLRASWYNVAARWAVRHLQQQQTFINEQQAFQLYLLQQQLDALAVQNAQLAQQLVALQRQIQDSEKA